MKQLLIPALILLLMSCGSPEAKQEATEGTVKVVAVYTDPKGVKYMDVLLREIRKTVKRDSATGKDIIATDTLWGYPAMLPLVDSLGKPLLDSFKKQQVQIVYNLISKDFVNWRVQNVSVDSLLKR